jgi:hypothetical protein
MLATFLNQIIKEHPSLYHLLKKLSLFEFTY